MRKLDSICLTFYHWITVAVWFLTGSCHQCGGRIVKWSSKVMHCTKCRRRL